MLTKKTVAALSCPTCGSRLVRLPASGGIWVCPDGLHSKEFPDHVLFERVVAVLSEKERRLLGFDRGDFYAQKTYDADDLRSARRVLRAIYLLYPPPQLQAA